MSLKPAAKKKASAGISTSGVTAIALPGLSITGVPKAPTSLKPLQVTPGQVVLRTADPPLTVTLRMDGPLKLTGGRGGWEFEDSPRDVQHTHYKGADGMTLEGVLVIHNPAGGSVEQRHAAFMRMAERPVQRAEPPSIRMDGNVPERSRTWVLAQAPDIQREVWSASYRTSISYGVVFFAYNPAPILGKASGDPYGLTGLKASGGSAAFAISKTSAKTTGLG